MSKKPERGRGRLAVQLPVMPLFVERLLGSSRVQALPGPARAAFLWMLVHEWNLRGEGLPADHKALARMLGYTKRQFTASVVEPQVTSLFIFKNGRLYNEQCELLISESRQKVIKARESGRKGAQARWGGDGGANGGANATALRNDSNGEYKEAGV